MRVADSSRKKRQRQQLDDSIKETARQLVELVHERIDADGRVDSDQIARIMIDGRFVGASFIDYPTDFLGLVEWRITQRMKPRDRQ